VPEQGGGAVGGGAGGQGDDRRASRRDIMSPVAQAPGQAEDERALADASGAVGIGRDVLRVDGPDAASFLQGQLSQDIEKLEVATPALSFLLRVTRIDDAAFLLDTDGGWGAAVLTALNRFKLRVKCDLQQLEWECLAVRGPEAIAVAGAIDALWATWPGYDLMGARVVAPEGIRACSAAAYEVERIAAGVPVMGAELDERTIPAESGLVDRAVSFTKGCYTGQELVARIDSRGHVNRHLRRLRVDGDVCPPAGALLGHPSLPGKDAGVITSAAWSESRSGAVALAYLRREVEPPASVDVTWDGGRATAQVQP
jgi:folate-binding protein YgfZ